ncbi:MAG: DUF2240 family protein [Candidatus Nanohaloarchaea archaeon]|nr:DUF2240 family protein [Candidatus Nanohaloarchaea archaeon]
MTEEIVDKIADETELEKKDIEEKIEAKEEEFSGLVSEEGAAHLVAKEHGVELSKEEDRELKVENVLAGMNRVNLKAQVVGITSVNTFERDDGSQGKVRNLVLGDETGTVRMSLWNDQLEVAEKLAEGDNIQIRGAYSREDNLGNPELRIGDSTKLKKIDSDEIKKVQKSRNSSSSHTDAYTHQITEPGSSYKVSGEIVKIYADNPFYQVCPECGSSLKEDDDYECNEHGEVEPDYRIALPAILDDGFDNIRCVFFNDRARKLLDSEDVEFKGNSRKLQEHAKKAVGSRVTVKGRAQENDFFDRIELLVNNVEMPDVEEQIEKKIEVIQND